ncbi:MAG: pyrimidine-nucleoside phosphorylase [Spirochaetaceae bacterium 4572_59]|nr:MAG: pyrimidine-nucleoside phosphorylase [Spirochaetaceae bacterium 4572_59]
MRIYDLIKKKRDGKELSKEEISFFVQEYTNENIPDYQAAAMLMAMFLKKMNKRETVDLTDAILHSGEQINLDSIEGVKVDKHSTGGVGDTTTLIVGPLVASCDVPLAKMSGRGLGHTGGTLDKLESIEGFKIDVSMEKFVDLVNTNKIAVISQTKNVAPADKKLYHLRDVTATVDSMPLIASSIMSKKLASGSDAILLDVKVGSGAFMKGIDEASELASEMVDIGKSMGRDTIAVITDMNQPLGNAIGNALEVKEAIEILKGEGPEDITKLCLELSAHIVVLGKKADSYEEAYKLVSEKLTDRSALRKFGEFVQAQGGNDAIIDDPSLLPTAEKHYEIKAGEDGFIDELNSEEIGLVAMMLGAGRETFESKLDYAAGLVLKKKISDPVKKGETVAVLHYNDDTNLESAVNRFNKAYTIVAKIPQSPLLIKKIIR